MLDLSLAAVFGAGFLSVLSPCVLPIVPILVTGTAEDHRSRPLLVVSGLSLTFMTMGLLSSLAGATLGPWLFHFEKVAAVLIILLGLLLGLGVNPFKSMTFVNRLLQPASGRLGGFALGAILGIVWIPCVGPILGAVLTLVASRGSAATGLFYLFVYSIGFSIPLLLAAYASQFFRNRLAVFGRATTLVRWASAVILITLGTYILFKGMLGFSTLNF